MSAVLEPERGAITRRFGRGGGLQSGRTNTEGWPREPADKVRIQIAGLTGTVALCHRVAGDRVLQRHGRGPTGF